MSAGPTNSPSALAKKAVAWSEAERLGQYTHAALAVVAGVTDRWISVWSQEWEAEGKVRCIDGAGPGRTRKRYEVVAPGEIVVPMIGDATDQMWTVMRKSPQGFTPTDLIAQIAVEASIEDARAYCHSLLAGGYLRCVAKAVPKRREAVYRLVSITGVKAPRLRRLRCIVDPNSGRITPMIEVRHG